MQTSVIEKTKNNDEIIIDMYNQISAIITNNKNKIFYQINNTLVETNFMKKNVLILNGQKEN